MSEILPLLPRMCLRGLDGHNVNSDGNPGAFAGWRGRKARPLAVLFPFHCVSKLILRCFAFLNGGVGKRAVRVLC